MAESADVQQFMLNIKGPSDLKVSVTVASDATVEQLKEAVSPDSPRSQAGYRQRD